MKKLSIIVLSIFFATTAIAAQQTIKDGGGLYVGAKEAVEANFTELYQGMGALQAAQPLVSVNSDAAAVSVSADDAAAGVTWLTTNAATTTYTLPPAAAGMKACFLMGSGNAQILRGDTDGTDFIVLSTGARTSAAGDYIGATSSAGNRICLQAFNDTDWYVTYTNGTWAEE